MYVLSNSNLGISLAAVTYVAAASPELSRACATHFPWNRADDIVPPGVLDIVGGSVAVPTRPGLGISLDRDLPRDFGMFGLTVQAHCCRPRTEPRTSGIGVPAPAHRNSPSLRWLLVFRRFFIPHKLLPGQLL